MREFRTWGSVRGVPGNWHPYRDAWTLRGTPPPATRTKVLNNELENTSGIGIRYSALRQKRPDPRPCAAFDPPCESPNGFHFVLPLERITYTSGLMAWRRLNASSPCKIAICHVKRNQNKNRT